MRMAIAIAILTAGGVIIAANWMIVAGFRKRRASMIPIAGASLGVVGLLLADQCHWWSVALMILLDPGTVLFLWSPIRWLEQSAATRGSGPVDDDAAPMHDSTHPSVVDYYLYFRLETSADKAIVRLRELGFEITKTLAAEGESWLVLARRTGAAAFDEMDDMESMLERLARRYSGEYDGHERSV